MSTIVQEANLKDLSVKLRLAIVDALFATNRTTGATETCLYHALGVCQELERMQGEGKDFSDIARNSGI